MRTYNAVSLRIVISSVILFGTYAGLLCMPQPLFPYSVRAAHLTLYSDRTIAEGAAKRALSLADEKLAHSPLYSGQHEYRIFLCNSRWRQILFFNKDYGAGGVAQYPITPNVFLRDARVEENRLLSSSGKRVMGDRTLDYYIAHEITHQLTGVRLGPARFYQLPQWVREGYADYVGKGHSFQYGDARRAFAANAPEMDFQRSGLYLRFHLLVAYLLDHEHWSVDRLLENPPPQAAVETAVKAERR